MKAPFYIIWNPDGARPPKFRHDTFVAARREAERLALENPGSQFFVMQAHCCVETSKPVEIEYFDTDSVPF